MPRILSVRTKILLVVAASVVALSLAIYTISSQVLLDSYLAIEREGMIEDLRRATDAIDEFENQQLIKLADWASWDQAYDYGWSKDRSWPDNNIYASGMANLDINAIAFADTSGALFYLIVADIDSRMQVSSSTVASYLIGHPDAIAHTPETSSKGLVMLPDGPMILVSLPLLTTEGTGPTPGSISFGRYLDAKKIEDLAGITHLSLSVHPYEGALPEDVARAKEALSGGESRVVIPLSSNAIAGYTLLKDLYDRPILILRVETPRPIFAQGNLTFLAYMGIGAIALLLFGVVIILLLDRLVIARFLRLTKDVEKINKDRSLESRVSGAGEDEIGSLASRINGMLGWLSEAREAEAASRREIVNLLAEVKQGKEQAEEMVEMRTKELGNEKARLLSSINSLSFGFVIADLENRILLKNPAIERILDIKKVPPTVGELAVMTKLSSDPVELAKECMRDKRSVELPEVPFGKKYLRFLCAPVFAEGGTEIIGYVLLVEDVTEARALERSRDEFFTIASHELRTPLTAIQGNASLLLSDRETPKSEERSMLEDIYVSSRRLIDIVNDFLEVSRLEQGKITWKREDFDLAEVTEGVARKLKEMVVERGLELNIVPPATPIKARADKARVEQVLDNLIGNAVKFTEKGSITVSAESKKGAITIRVTDTGTGIPVENQGLLFHKFQQAGKEILARDVSESTGLGLYISKLIVEAMGGKIWLESSEPGKGSVFAFTVPAA